MFSISLMSQFVLVKDFIFITHITYVNSRLYWKQIHYSNQGQAFKSQVQSMHIEILQSPWLCELMAFHINLRETKTKKRNAPDFFDGCSLIFNDGKPSLSFQLLDSVKMDIDLTCPICLVRLLFSSVLFILVLEKLESSV